MRFDCQSIDSSHSQEMDFKLSLSKELTLFLPGKSVSGKVNISNVWTLTKLGRTSILGLAADKLAKYHCIFKIQFTLTSVDIGLTPGRPHIPHAIQCLIFWVSVGS